MNHALALDTLDAVEDAARLQKAIRAWKRRSRLVHFFRTALPAAMAAVLLALAVTVSMQTLGRKTEPQRAVEVRMVNPTFRSRDDEGRAFVLSAREAVRDVQNFQLIRLTDPELELQSAANQAPLRVTAKSGVYLETTQLMTLNGAVKLVDPTGWVFDTEKAVIDTRRDIISGDKPVQGVGPTQRISAERYAIYNRGERILLTGKTRTFLNTR